MRRGVEVGVWFVLLLGGYLVFIGSVTGLEAGVGAAVAATSAVLAVLARSAERLRDRPAARWLAWLPAVPLAVLADTGRLAALLAARGSGRAGWAGRAGPGRFSEVELGPTADRHRSAQRAVAMLVISLAPGSYVVGADWHRGVLRVHRIGRPTAAAARLDRRLGR